jgi:electron transfer flavoprotein-quinone oxidoreductase
LDVIVIERGEYSGSKNMGGLLYSTTLNQIIPDFYKKAPIERPVSKRSLSYLGEKNHFSLTFGSDDWSEGPYNNSFIIYRSQFDKWYASQTESAGADLLEGTTVDDLIYSGSGNSKKVIGVKIRSDEGDDEEFFSDIVILAEGANALLTEKAVGELNIKQGKDKQDFAVGVKEIIGMKKEVIEDRFNLAENEGMALDFFGYPFKGTIGGGFIYTGKEALHLGFAGRAQSLVESKVNPSEILDKFKNHSRIRPLIEGGELLEYSAHLIPEGGYNAIGDLTANGLMIIGDAAGLVNMSLYKEGTNHAIESGKIAAETAITAKKKDNFSKQILSHYEKKLKSSYLFEDLKKYKKIPPIMEKTPELFSLYPEKIAQLMTDYFTVSAVSKSKLQKSAMKKFKKGLSKLKMICHIMRAKKLL